MPPQALVLRVLGVYTSKPQADRHLTASSTCVMMAVFFLEQVMAVIIMQSKSSLSGYSLTQTPHAVWEGSYKDAVKWCENKNCSARSYTYEAVKVKTEGVQS